MLKLTPLTVAHTPPNKRLELSKRGGVDGHEGDRLS
jgi:hypothetical protein